MKPKVLQRQGLNTIVKLKFARGLKTNPKRRASQTIATTVLSRPRDLNFVIKTNILRSPNHSKEWLNFDDAERNFDAAELSFNADGPNFAAAGLHLDAARLNLVLTTKQKRN